MTLLPGRTRRIHCGGGTAEYTVYIGRGHDPKTDRNPPTRWGNPFRIPQDGDRADVVMRHREWLLMRPYLVHRAREQLKGQVLGCWCPANEACHGDTLVAFAESMPVVHEVRPCPKAGTDHYHCQFCDGGLSECAHCGSFEGATTTECPRRKMTSTELDLVYEGDLNYLCGEWVRGSFSEYDGERRMPCWCGPLYWAK